LTASLAVELKDKNVRVNSISPGMVDTASFPKPPGKPGVRTAESIADGLFVLLESEVTGHYLHVDELDEVRRRGLDDRLALKPIHEPNFRELLSEQKA
jgi:NAD(P)-dependent dehydrogenase (short-subunit alcohol dehydrogenase family)